MSNHGYHGTSALLETTAEADTHRLGKVSMLTPSFSSTGDCQIDWVPTGLSKDEHTTQPT
ncbi:595_t:CDS:2, partial [Funneliformis geosporum]